MSEIALTDVTKSWGTTVAVDRVGFTAAPGTLLVLLGPSGCGKSTTLRLIAGLDRLTSGRIVIGGRDVSRLAPTDRGVSMVFQSYALFPHLSVAQNIVFGLEVRKVPPAERRRRLDRAVALLGLGGLLDRRPSQLSGGQQQRVALGRAIVAEKPVCLMDEPLSNLDAQLRHDMRREIRALQQQLGMTMVYVTHDQTEAMTMADQVILLRAGRIEQDASPADLYARPATVFAAGFIGTPPMNLIRLAAGDGGPVVEGTAIRVDLSHPGTGLTLGIRPEEVRLVERPGLPAVVSTIEYLGAESIVGVRVGGQTLSARVPGRSILQPGAPVALAWAPDRIHLFETSTGRRLDEDAPRPIVPATQKRSIPA